MRKDSTHSDKHDDVIIPFYHFVECLVNLSRKLAILVGALQVSPNLSAIVQQREVALESMYFLDFRLLHFEKSCL